SQCRVIS
ncbi:transcriptional regulatory protein ompR, partial [Vibrio parahaemolyticus V-223/04]